MIQIQIETYMKMFKNPLIKNDNATICQITMKSSSDNEDLD